MSLADRLDIARRSSEPTPAAGLEHGSAGARRRNVDPFAEVKGRAHQALIDSLGLRFYDPDSPGGDQAQVRQTSRRRSTPSRRRFARRPHPHRAGGLRRDPRPRAARALLRDAEITEIMVNGADSISSSAPEDLPGRGALQQRGAPAPGHRQDRRAQSGAARGEPARRRPTARRVPCSTRSSHLSPSTAPCSPSGSSPRTPSRMPTSSPSAPMSPAVRDFKACVIGRQHHHLRRYGLREDDDAQRHLLLPPEDERIITIEDAAVAPHQIARRAAPQSRLRQHRGPGPHRHP